MSFVKLIWTNRLNSTDSGAKFVQLPTTIGRAAANGVVLDGQQTGISRRHLSLTCEKGHYFMTDLHSTNGVYFKGRRVARALLTHGAAFDIGAYRFTFVPQVRCGHASCSRLVDAFIKTCPHCGQFMADAETNSLISKPFKTIAYDSGIVKEASRGSVNTPPPPL